MRKSFALVCACLGTVVGPALAAVPPTDYARGRSAEAWLRHPVYGDPSFDTFERRSGNPLHRGSPPYEWPVNGFLFSDPVSRQWYAYIGDYGRGYMHPPSRCLLYRSPDEGRSWTSLGVVLQGDPGAFDRGGHTPDVSVVYADGRYHMVYDWGLPDFNAEGGLAYAWAEQPEGPWHRAPEPITRNSTLTRLLGRYQRTYAATLVRRRHDWMILGMMDHPPNSWVLFALTAPRPEGPYGERQLVLYPETDRFHPPLLEFFPAFTHGRYVYAPATSVAANRNFNALFRAPLERATDPAAWALVHHGSTWHAEDEEHETAGLWGQTYAGFVDGKGQLQVLFPSRDAQGRGTINLASRRWKKPFRTAGFVLTGHEGPSLTLLRTAYREFTLEAEIQARGTVRLLVDYDAPLGPLRPESGTTLHSLSMAGGTALELAPEAGSWAWRDLRGPEGPKELARGQFTRGRNVRLQVRATRDTLRVDLGNQALLGLPRPSGEGQPVSGMLGWWVQTNSHLTVERFRVNGAPQTARIDFLATEALLGAGETLAHWLEVREPAFRHGFGLVSRQTGARVKWNVAGHALTLWSPRGPEFGSVEIRLDGRSQGQVDLQAATRQPSAPVWSVNHLPDTFHAVVLVGKTGQVPVDCLQVESGPRERGR